MRVVVIGNTSASLVRFRGDLLQAMQAAGHEVFACAGEREDAPIGQLRHWGIPFAALPLSRRGTSALVDGRLYWEIRKIIRKVRPDMVFAYTIKPVIYGSLAARHERVRRIAALIPGAGAACSGSMGFRQAVLSFIIRRLYRAALKHVDRVIFQNMDDLDYFVRSELVSREKAARVWGSGVNLERFPFRPPVLRHTRFTLISRLLKAKGIPEFAEASRRLREEGFAFEAQIAGWPEEGNAAVPLEQIERWQNDGHIKYLGVLKDVRQLLAETSVYVLPSYYPEGIPRTNLEAMATGRAVVTANSVGCRETVIDGVNGLLVPPRDVVALMNAMRQFIQSPQLVEQMGRESRRLAEERFDVHRVNQEVMEILGLTQRGTT